MRKLAHIERITNIRPIAGKDRIEQANVLGWNIIIAKGEFQEGDLCVYVEIDSKMPSSDLRFAFLEKRDFKIKTMKMGGVLSQGIAFPLSLFPEIKNPKEGADVTDKLKITKIATNEERRLAREEAYDRKRIDAIRFNALKKRLPRFSTSAVGEFLLSKKITRKILLAIFGRKLPSTQFPNWIAKTDEMRVQNAPFHCGDDIPYVVTEKIDGTSTTFAVEIINKKKHDFIVCSRTVRQLDEGQECYFGSEVGNVYWEIARKYGIEATLLGIAAFFSATRVVLQGETIGPNIQGNPYGLLNREFYGYNLIIDGRRLSSPEAAKIVKDYGIKWVPILDEYWFTPATVEEMLECASGDSELAAGVRREGLVLRAVDDPTNSFKAVSNEFLLEKHPEVAARDAYIRNLEKEKGRYLTEEERIEAINQYKAVWDT